MAWPTTNDPKTEFATFRMTATEAADLDRAAQKEGMSRSGYVRDCVRRVRTAEEKRAARLRGQESA